jgi:hypothetical protein
MERLARWVEKRIEKRIREKQDVEVNIVTFDPR